MFIVLILARTFVLYNNYIIDREEYNSAKNFHYVES